MSNLIAVIEEKLYDGGCWLCGQKASNHTYRSARFKDKVRHLCRECLAQFKSEGGRTVLYG